MSKIIAEIDAAMGDEDLDGLEHSNAVRMEYGDVGRIEHLATAETFEKQTEAMHSEIQISDRKVTTQSRTRNITTVNEGQGREQASDSNLPEKEAEEVKPSEIFEEILDYVRFLLPLLGMRLSFHWEPRKYAMFFFMWFLLFAILFTICYTIHIHCVNENYVRIIAPVALSGMSISVSGIFNF